MLLHFLWSLRVALTFAPQHGYIQPDEFFQFTEPIANFTFPCQATIVWEMLGPRPIRNMFLPYVVSKSAFSLCHLISSDPSPYLLLVIPRVFFALLSFLADWSLYKIVSMGRQINFASENGYYARVAFASSYVAMTYLTHTFTNSLELVLFCLLLQQIICCHRKSYSKLTIGILLAVGFFNRPTFAAFALIPIVWFYLRTSLRRVISVALFACVTSSFLIIFDTLYYNYSGIVTALASVAGRKEGVRGGENAAYADVDDFYERVKLLMQQVITTPVNFVLYNSKSENLANHGLHPRYLHIINLFFLSGVLALYSLGELVSICLALAKREMHLAHLPVYKKVSLGTLITSLFILSLFPHQEPRFLLPCFFLVTLDQGHKIVKCGRLSLVAWIIFNVSLTYFYGFIHQAGVTKSLFWLHSHSKSYDGRNASVIMTTMYLPPLHLLNLPSTSSEEREMLRLLNLSVAPFPDALDESLKLLTRHPSTSPPCYSFLIIAHSLYQGTIRTLLRYWNLDEDATVITSFFPHFSAEVLADRLMDVFTDHISITSLFALDVWSVKKCPQIL